MTEVTYMTILWITMLGGPLDGDTYGIPFVSEESCIAAKKTVSDSLDYDHNMICETLPVEKEMEP